MERRIACGHKPHISADSSIAQGQKANAEPESAAAPCMDWTQLVVLGAPPKLIVPRYRLELQAYGKTHFSWRGRDGYRIKIPRGSGGEKPARRFRHILRLPKNQTKKL